MSSIEKRGKRWRVRWRDGDSNRTSPSFATKDEAERWQIAHAAREAARRHPTGIAMTGLELAERWRVALAKRGRTAHYVQTSPDRVIRAIGGEAIARLRRDALLDLPVGSRRLVQSCLRWGVEEARAAVPAECLKLPTGQRQRIAPPDLMADDVWRQVQAAADAADLHLGTIVHLVGHYGHRPESLAKLCAEDVQYGAQPKITLTVKGGDRITHPIAEETAERLRADPPPFRDYLTDLPYPSGWDISVRYRSRVGRAVCPDTPGIYALKRRAISAMLARGLDAATVASITGHRRPDVLIRHYARTNEDRQRRALVAIFAPPLNP